MARRLSTTQPGEILSLAARDLDRRDCSHYPGALSPALEVVRLASSYHDAANSLGVTAKHGDHLSRAPYRLLAIHAIELYLNAWLLHAGHSPARVRKLQHDLGVRAALALAGGLVIRRKTAKHLQEMSAVREYLVTRYDTRMGPSLSQITRIQATLADVSKKVCGGLSPQVRAGKPD